MCFVNDLRGAASTSYAPHAIAEADFRNRRARHIYRSFGFDDLLIDMRKSLA